MGSRLHSSAFFYLVDMSSKPKLLFRLNLNELNRLLGSYEEDLMGDFKQIYRETMKYMNNLAL